MNVSTALVTGANGFIGRALTRELLNSGYKVKALTRRPCQFDVGVENIVIPDLMSAPHLAPVLKGVDVVIHLAARVHVMQESDQDALSAYRAINVDATLSLAKAAAAAGVARFIYLSSIKVNGEKTLHGAPFTAESIPMPEDPYGVSKLEAEKGLITLSQLTGMEVVIIRPPLIYGPHVKANFASMMKWVSYGLPLPLGSIHNLRSMVSLPNLLSLIKTCITHSHASGNIFLVSDDRDVSVTRLLNILALAMKRKIWLMPVPPALIKILASAFGKEAVAQRLCDNLQVDISKTKKLLNWTPPMGLDEGLQLTVDWYLEK